MQTDEELVARHIRGDEIAFAQLVARHLKTVFSFTARFVGNEQEAEDITQESFLKAWKNIAKYDPKTSKFRTWLLRIARNSAIDHLRKKKHIPFSDFETAEGQNVLAETVPDPEALPEELFARVERAQEIAAALAELSPKHREILLLHYTNGLTFEEISQMTGEPKNTVKSRHHRALIALRKLVPEDTRKGGRTPGGPAIV